MPSSCSTGYDVIVDGADNFPTRYLVNDACVLLGKPNAYGAIFRFEGQASVFAAKDGPCYRCLLPGAAAARRGAVLRRGRRLGRAARPHRDDPGHRGHQADHRDRRDASIGRLMVYDALRMAFRELKVRKDPDCPVCGTHAHRARTGRLRRVLRRGAGGAQEPQTAVRRELDSNHHRRRPQGPDGPGRPAVPARRAREPFEHQIVRLAGRRPHPDGRTRSPPAGT